MIRIFLINLDRSPERLAFMQAQFERLGLSFERVAAVDGSKIDLAPYAGSGLSPGEIGCFLSHRTIWQQLAGSKDSHALVLEDDVRLSKSLTDILARADWIPPAAELVKLDTSGKRIGASRSRFAAPDGRTLHRLRTIHTGTAGYIVSRAYAARLLEQSAALREAVDHFMFGTEPTANPDHGINQLVPAAVAQEKRFNRRSGLESLIYHERKVKRPLHKRVGRATLKPFLQVAAAILQAYRSMVDDMRYLRVPFR